MKIHDWAKSASRALLRLQANICAIVLTLLSSAAPASAAVWCNGRITQVYTERGGGLLILPSFRNQWIQICSVQTEWKGILPQTCNAWASTVISGMLAGKAFTVAYTELDDCAQIPDYQNAPSPAYVMLYQ